MMARSLKGQLDGRFKAEVERADDWVDQALAALEEEEPSLASWLDTDESINRALTANASAIYWTIISVLAAGDSLEDAMERVDKLVERLVHATALVAAMRERDRS